MTKRRGVFKAALERHLPWTHLHVSRVPPFHRCLHTVLFLAQLFLGVLSVDHVEQRKFIEVRPPLTKTTVNDGIFGWI